MTNKMKDSTQHIAVRVAGFMFLLNFILPAYWGFFFSKITAADDMIATANNIIANVFQFRIAVINELVCSVAG